MTPLRIALPTVARYIEKITLVSDNDAYNRLYEWLGPEAVEARMAALGHEGVRIRHRLSVSLSPEAMQRLNPAPGGAGAAAMDLGRAQASRPGASAAPRAGGASAHPRPKAFDEKNAYRRRSWPSPEPLPPGNGAADAAPGASQGDRRWFLSTLDACAAQLNLCGLARGLCKASPSGAGRRPFPRTGDFQ